jgi:colicin import membrane protein
VSLRTGLEKLRLDMNRADRESIAERIKLRDDEAKRIAEQIVAIETPLDEQIRADEARREEERLAKIEAERARQAGIRERIALIANVLRRSVGRQSAEIEAKIALVQSQTIDAETFAEFAAEAAITKDDTLTQLRELLQATQQAESAAEALAVQRAENERRAAELAKQEAEAAAERERQRSIEALLRRAEAEAQAEHQRAIDAEAIERRKAMLAELDRQIAARNAEHEAQMAEQRAREAEQQRREAEQAEEQRQAERAQREAEQRLHGQAQAMFDLLVEALDESFVSPRAKGWKARTEQVIALVYGKRP